MLQPKKDNFKLNQADQALLEKEMIAYAEEGATDDDLIEFKNTYIAEKKKATPKSASTAQNQKLASETNIGSLDGVGSNDFGESLKTILPNIQTKVEPRDMNSKDAYNAILQRDANLKKSTEYGKSLNDRVIPKKELPIIDKDTELRNQIIRKIQPLADQATTITDADLANIESDYNKELNNSGFQNTFKSAIASVVNPLARAVAEWKETPNGEKRPELINTDNPLKKYEDMAVEEATKENKKITPEEKTARAKELFFDNRKSEIIQSRLNDVNHSLTDDEQKIIKNDRFDKIHNLGKENKSLLKNIPILVGNRDETIKDIEDTYHQILDLHKANQPIPEDLKNQFETLQNRGQRYDSELNSLYQKYNSNKKDLGTFKQEYDVYKTENNRFLNGVGRLGNALIGMGGEALDFGAYIANASSNLPKNEVASVISELLHAKANDFHKQVEDNSQYLQHTSSVEDASDFIDKTLDFTIDNIPMVTAFTLTGGVGVAGMAATTAGAKYGEMANDDKSNYSQLQKTIAPALYGATMVAPMLTQLNTIRNGARVVEAIATESPELLQKSLLKKSEEILTKYIPKHASSSFKLANELKGMEFLQEGVNHFVLGKDIDYKKLADAGVYETAPLLHAMNVVAPHLLMAGTKPFMSVKEVEQLDNNSKKLFDLYGKLQDPKLDKSEKAILQSTIDAITKDSQDLVKGKINGIANTPKLLVDALINATQKSSDLRAKAIRVNSADNSTFSPEQKKVILDNLKNEYRENEKERIDILQGNKTVVDVLPLKEQDKLKRTALKELTAELNPDGKKNVEITNSQITERANKNYLKPQEVAVTETKPQAEVPQQAEAEKVNTEPKNTTTEPTTVVSDNKEVSPVEDVVATSVEEIKKLIPNTKIINKNGEPIKVYHGTRSADDFTSFEKGDIGFHFGRKETAKQRGENVLEVYLDIKNPIDIKDNGAFEGQELVDSLYDAKVLNEEEYDYFSNEMSELPEDEIYGYNTDVNKQLRDKIKEKGYDGFTYTNMYEGSAGKSFIALDNSQIIFSESLKNEATPQTNTPKPQEVSPVEDVVDSIVPELDIKIERGGVFSGEFLNDYDFLAEGSEHTVYRSKDGKTVIKIGEPHNSNETYQARVDDALAINNLLGDGSLEVIGTYRSPNGTINPVYRQNFMDGKIATQEQVAEHLINNGFTQTGKDTFTINKDGKTLEISDTSDNFIINDSGEIIAIDASIREIQNEATPTTNTPTNGNVSVGPNSMGKVGVEQKPTAEVVAEESIQSANDVGKDKGYAEIENIDEIANFLKDEFINPKQEEKVVEKPKATKEQVVEPVKETKLEQAKGFVSMAVKNLTTSLKDFQGRAKEYSEDTYNRIVNEAKEGVLNISSIPPIQIWKNPETGQFVILAGHSRTKAFSDLAEGKVEFADKYKKSDFEKVNTQIVEAETLEEAQKIAQESNQGSAQTVVDNAKYVRESLLSTFQNFNQAKTKLKSLYGPAWARIYAYANLNPKGKAMQMLKLFQDANESDSNDKSKKIAEWTGKTRADFDKLTDAHENEIFDFLSKNDKIKTYSELSELLNRRVNGLEEFNQNEPLNFEQKVGRGSNEVEIVKEIQDLKNRDVQIKKKIKELQSFGKNINDTQRKQVKDLTAESIKINTVDIPNAQVKQKQARVADAEQFDIFSQINEQIENGNITSEQVDEFVNDDRKAEEIDPIVEVIESKAKGYNKAELEEVVAEVDAVLANEENKQSEYKFSNSPSLKNAQAVDSSVLPITPKATENILKNEGTWNKAIIGDVKNLGNGWFEVGKTVKGESILYSPTTDKAVTIVDSENKGGRNAVYVNDFINNNPTILEKQQLKDKANAEIDTDLVSKEYYEKFQKDFPNTLLAIEEKNGLITIFENGETREVEDYEFVKELKNALAKGYKGIVKVTRKVVDTETKKLRAKAEVDRIAQKIKDILPGIDDPDLKKQGFSQDQLIDLVASTVKTLVSKGIDINDAIRQVIASIKERFNVDVDENLVKEKLGVEKEISKDELSDFRDLIRDIPQKDEVKNYLSGETIERVHGETRNDQSYNVVSLADLALHGKLVMDKAKELFGDQYVEKTLDFLENSNLEADEKAIQYVALENEMDARISENPNDLGERKLQDLVRKKSQAHLRKSAIAINAGRLRAIMKYGIDVNSYPDEILTSKQKQAKSEIEKLVQHTSEDINKEAEIQEEEGFVIAEPKAKRDKAIVKSEISDVIKKLRADLIKSARGQSINISIPYAEQVRIATPHIIKLSKLFAELGGMKTKEIIDAIHDELSKVFPAIKKSDVSSVLKEVYEDKAKPKDKKIQDIVKQALIDAGFSRKVKIKGEEKTLLDWKKLAGEESSIPKLKENVEKSLKGQGYTDSQIKEIGKSLEDEYIRLGADIVEKGLRELENRNKLKPSPTRKTDAKRLSELYNYGLFNGEKATEYDNLLNKTLGLSEFDVETYQKIKSLAKALASVYNQENNGRKISEIAVQTLNSTINHQIKSLLAESALKNGPKYFKISQAFDDYVGLSMRALLGSVSTLTENKISGEFQVQLQKAFSSGEITPELKKQIEADKKAVFRDITRNAGLFYGDTNTSLTHNSRFEEWLNGKADKAMAHTVVSSFLLRAVLDGVDSSVKVRLTQKAFVKNVIKLLTSETNPNGKMSTEEAIKYVSEQLTGENFEKALKTAKSIIENVNEEQGKKVIKDTDEAIHRFAMDLVKENLLSSNMLTMDNIESAYKSAYKSSGRSIGHEANNVISAGVNLLSSTLNKRLEKAIQEKNYPLATSLTLLSTIQKSILNLFVGGGTNWVILGLEKSGNPLGYISVIHNATERRKLDLSENKSDITQSLYRESIYKDSAVRLLVGTGLAMAMFAVLTAGDDDEELLGKLNQWLKDNPWAKKHFNKLAPEAVTFLIDMKNGELSKHWQKVLGMKNDYFDNTKTLINTFSDENSSMSGAFGAFVGQNLSSPGPWKTIKDVRDILRGLKGLPEIKTDYKTSGFWNGYFRAGFVDFAKLRPGVNYDLNSKIDKVKDDAKKLNSEIDSFVKKIYDDKLPNDQINKKINELFDKEPLKKEKIINAIKNRAEEEKLKRSGVDPFYIKLKRESNDEIKAILFQDRFKDLSKTTPAEQKEIEKGMNAIKFGEGSKEFWDTYWRLAHPENYKKKPIN